MGLDWCINGIEGGDVMGCGGSGRGAFMRG